MIPRPAIWFALLLPGLLLAQLTTGFLEGTLRAPGGTEILITGGAGFRASVTTDARGRFAIALPYGRYELSLDARPRGFRRPLIRVGAAGHRSDCRDTLRVTVFRTWLTARNTR